MSDLFCLKGKVTLVTRASSGLGVQFAKALAKQGAVIYFASDASSYTTGQLLCIDGGWTVM